MPLGASVTYSKNSSFTQEVKPGGLLIPESQIRVLGEPGPLEPLRETKTTCFPLSPFCQEMK